MGIADVVAMVLALGAGIGGTFAAVFYLIARVQKRLAEDLILREGLVLRSGRTWISMALDNYRSEARYSSWRRSRNRGEVLLTNQALVVLHVVGFRFSDVDIASLQVAAEGTTLLLKTDNPPAASGRVELRFRVNDPSAWVAALGARGARSA